MFGLFCNLIIVLFSQEWINIHTCRHAVSFDICTFQNIWSLLWLLQDPHIQAKAGGRPSWEVSWRSLPSSRCLWNETVWTFGDFELKWNIRRILEWRPIGMTVGKGEGGGRVACNCPLDQLHAHNLYFGKLCYFYGMKADDSWERRGWGRVACCPWAASTCWVIFFIWANFAISKARILEWGVIEMTLGKGEGDLEVTCRYVEYEFLKGKK